MTHPPKTVDAAAKAAFRAAQNSYREEYDHFPLKYTWETATEDVRDCWRRIAAAAVTATAPPADDWNAAIEALRPFVERLDTMEKVWPERKQWADNICVWSGMEAPTIGMLRAARRALTRPTPSVPEPALCEDEGCLHSDTAHVCVSSKALLADIAIECILRGMKKEETVVGFIKRAMPSAPEPEGGEQPVAWRCNCAGVTEKEIATALCASHGTAQCAALCLSHFASKTAGGKCPEKRRVYGRQARAILARIAQAGQSEVGWRPIESKPPFVPCEERGIYTDKNSDGLFFFKATHWRPLSNHLEVDRG